jgi:hypothetical protein
MTYRVRLCLRSNIFLYHLKLMTSSVLTIAFPKK